MQFIQSTSNEKIRYMAALQTAKGRKSENAFPIEGEKMVLEALEASFQPRLALIREDCLQLPVVAKLEKSCPCFACSEQAISKASDAVSPQGIIAAFDLPKPSDLKPKAVVFLDGVQDPGNCGTIWRTCEAAGFDQIVFAGEAVDPYSPKVVRASMGAVFRIPAVRIRNSAQGIEEYRKDGFTVLASALNGKPFFERPNAGERYVLVIGSEAHGVSQSVLDLADQILRLPMAGKVESLNAGIAAGVMMYDLFIKEGMKR